MGNPNFLNQMANLN